MPVDQRAQSLLQETTHSPAHSLVLKALAAARASPGMGWKFDPPRVEESHISLATLDTPALAVPDHPIERPVPGAVAGFQAATASPFLPLSLHAKVGCLDAQRGTPPTQTVAFLEVVDPSGALGCLQAAFHEASGIPPQRAAPIHLTLGSLRLGTRLLAEVEAAVARHVIELGTCEATDLVLGGRRGANLALRVLGPESATSR